MGERPNPRAAGWTLEPVTEAERPLLLRLYELYLHDFSELAHADVDEEGRFLPLAEPYVERYRTTPGRHALLLRVGGRPAGFVLLAEAGGIKPDHHYVGEVFAARTYRRRGYGTGMAHELFGRFPGRWWIEEIAPNVGAQAFWRRAVGAYTGGRYAEQTMGGGEVVQTFDTRDNVTP